MVTRWSGVLRKCAIPFAVTHSVDDDGIEQQDQLEIWVEKEDSKKARAAIIEAERGNGTGHQ